MRISEVVEAITLPMWVVVTPRRVYRRAFSLRHGVLAIISAAIISFAIWWLLTSDWARPRAIWSAVAVLLLLLYLTATLLYLQRRQIPAERMPVGRIKQAKQSIWVGTCALLATWLFSLFPVRSASPWIAAYRGVLAGLFARALPALWLQDQAADDDKDWPFVASIFAVPLVVSVASLIFSRSVVIVPAHVIVLAHAGAFCMGYWHLPAWLLAVVHGVVMGFVLMVFEKPRVWWALCPLRYDSVIPLPVPGMSACLGELLASGDVVPVVQALAEWLQPYGWSGLLMGIWQTITERGIAGLADVAPVLKYVRDIAPEGPGTPGSELVSPLVEVGELLATKGRVTPHEARWRLERVENFLRGLGVENMLRDLGPVFANAKEKGCQLQEVPGVLFEMPEVLFGDGIW